MVKLPAQHQTFEKIPQYLLSRSANPDLVNSLGETADTVGGAGAEVFVLVKDARRKKQGAI